MMNTLEAKRETARRFRRMADVADTGQNATALKTFAAELDARADGAQIKERVDDQPCANFATSPGADQPA